MKWNDNHGATRCAKLLLLVFVFTLATSSISYAQNAYQRMVRRIESTELGFTNPSGLVYSPDAHALFAASSQGATSLMEVSSTPDLTEVVKLAAVSADPVNMAFDGRSNSMLFWDAGAGELVEIGDNGRSPTRYDSRTFGLAGARGLTIDPDTGDLFALVVAAKPAVARIVRLVPSPQGGFAAPVVSSVVANGLQNEDLRGIAFNPNDGHLYVLAPEAQKLYELTLEGDVLSSRDLSDFALRGARNMVFAPSGDRTDDPEIMSLYITESGRSTTSAGQTVLMGAGQDVSNIVELSLTQPEVLDLSPLMVQAALVRTVQTSQWSPASPDPAGIAYIPTSNNLMVSDSEVNEMSIFKGVNYWQTALNGSPVKTYATTSFSDEPTGVAYNPSNHHLFFSDDTGTRSVYELNPGSDGKYNTSDDVVTSFKTGDFSSADPEGIAYDTFQGHLFVVDGVNAEVYEIDPGPNGVFDGTSSGGDDIVKHFDTSRLGLSDPEGVEFNYDSGNLYIAGRGVNYIVETKRDGTPVSTVDVSAASPKKLAGVAYGPSSGNASQRSLYLVDRGTDNDSNPNENDGKLYEISLGATTSTPSLTINDVTVQEGNSGTVDAVFTVSLSSTSQQTVTVNYATANGSATTADNDYASASGQLSFSSSQTTRTITVKVNGDTSDEGTEDFFVNLSNASNATIGDNQGVGTITDDDGTGPMVASFKDGVNGYSGTRDAVLKAESATTNYGHVLEGELDGQPDESSLLYWDVSSIPIGSVVESVDIVINITNTSNGDYELFQVKRPWVENEVTWNQFAIGQNWQTAGAQGSQDIGSAVLGAITGASSGLTTISLNSAGVAVVQTWINDPASNNGLIAEDYVNHSNGLDFSSREASPNQRPELRIAYTTSGESILSIDDVTVDEGNGGTVDATFTVTLFPASTKIVTVDFATANGTASAGSDYVSKSGKLTFNPGETSKSITVVVNGDTDEEGDETFFVNLSNATNAPIGIDQGTGTITGDDGTGPVVVSFQDGLDGYSGTRDASIKFESADTNYGSELNSELDGSPDESALLFWDVSTIPAGSTIESVDITVNVTNTSSGTYELYEVKRSWVENEVTWNQAASGQSWGSAGVQGAVDKGSTVLGAFVGPNTGIIVTSLNAAGVAVVQSWVDGSSVNHGLIAQDYINHSNGLSYSSREVGAITNRPKLTVRYSNGGQTTPQVVTTSSDEDVALLETLPQTLALSPNYPNPFSLETRIEYALPQSGSVQMKIYNIRGQLVRTLVDEVQPAGYKMVVWDGRDDSGRSVASGVYFNRLLVDQQSMVGKIVLQK